jgi:hypothetical protein
MAMMMMMTIWKESLKVEMYSSAVVKLTPISINYGTPTLIIVLERRENHFFLEDCNKCNIETNDEGLDAIIKEINKKNSVIFLARKI